MPDPKPKFKAGDRVSLKAYTDCFEEHHAEVAGLTVARVYFVACKSTASYWRITAVGPAGRYDSHEMRFKAARKLVGDTLIETDDFEYRGQTWTLVAINNEMVHARANRDTLTWTSDNASDAITLFEEYTGYQIDPFYRANPTPDPVQPRPPARTKRAGQKSLFGI